MEILEPIAALVWFAWVVLTIWSIIQITKLVWPVLKDDWFWFASKATREYQTDQPSQSRPFCSPHTAEKYLAGDLDWPTHISFLR